MPFETVLELYKMLKNDIESNVTIEDLLKQYSINQIRSLYGFEPIESIKEK